MSYCDSAPGHPYHGSYHDTEYGFPVRDLPAQAGDSTLFERLVLEINQAGLSWLTVLKKREGFYDAYDGFDIETVAAYGQKDRERLLSDERIIRNRLKVDAAIHNAGVIRELQETHGSFAAWIRVHHPRPKKEWVKLFKKTFKFTGGEITGEFLMSIGYLPGAHDAYCPVYEKIAALGPPWMAISGADRCDGKRGDCYIAPD